MNAAFASRYARSINIGAIIIVSLVTVVWIALKSGQDFNYDQQNYHIGVPLTLARGTFWTHIFPAGIQSYFNPLLIQLQFALMQALPPRAFAAILAATQSLAFIAAGLVCNAVAREQLGPGRDDVFFGRAVPGLTWRALAFLGFLLCLLAPVALSEVGATMIDLWTGALVIASFGLLLTRDGRFSRVVLAGALIGAAVAFKLTNGVFAIGALAFALAGRESWRARLLGVVAFGFSALLVFALVAGPWHLELWRRFHNPFFPYFNTVFHSPYFLAETMRDERFLPTSIVDFWRYPLYWVIGDSPRPDLATPSTEVRFVDVRWALLLIGSMGFIAALAVFPEWRRRKLAENATGLLFAILLSYSVWLAAFGIHRYLAPIDILCGAGLLFLCLQIGTPRVRLALLALLVITVFAPMKKPSWGHEPFARDLHSLHSPAPLPTGPVVVFLTSKPSFYVAEALPPSWRYVGFYGDVDVYRPGDGGFGDQLAAVLREDPAPVLMMLSREKLPASTEDVLRRFGLSASDRCQTLRSDADSFQLCAVGRR